MIYDNNGNLYDDDDNNNTLYDSNYIYIYSREIITMIIYYAIMVIII